MSSYKIDGISYAGYTVYDPTTKKDDETGLYPDIKGPLDESKVESALVEHLNSQYGGTHTTKLAKEMDLAHLGISKDVFFKYLCWADKTYSDGGALTAKDIAIALKVLDKADGTLDGNFFSKAEWESQLAEEERLNKKWNDEKPGKAFDESTKKCHKIAPRFIKKGAQEWDAMPTGAAPKPTPAKPTPGKPAAPISKQPKPYPASGNCPTVTDPYATSTATQRQAWNDVQAGITNMNDYILNATNSNKVTVNTGMTLSLIAKAILHRNGIDKVHPDYKTKLIALTDKLVETNSCSTVIKPKDVVNVGPHLAALGLT